MGDFYRWDRRARPCVASAGGWLRWRGLRNARSRCTGHFSPWLLREKEDSSLYLPIESLNQRKIDREGGGIGEFYRRDRRAGHDATRGGRLCKAAYYGKCVGAARRPPPVGWLRSRDQPYMAHEAPIDLVVVRVDLYCSLNEFISTKLKTDLRVWCSTHIFDERQSHMADLITVTSSKIRSLVVKSAWKCQHGTLATRPRVKHLQSGLE